jgi:MFS superfamily sulfate permease-like transporter
VAEFIAGVLVGIVASAVLFAVIVAAWERDQ